jgi:hypothetical protein
MTEAEWLSATDPTSALKSLRGTVSDRKLRLFAVACGRAISHYFPTQAYHDVITFAESFADGIATRRQLEERWREVSRHSNSLVAMATCGVADTSASYAALKTVDRTQGLGFPGRSQSWLLREIVPNPFRPVAFDPRWRTADVTALARGIYEDRAFDRLPLLADALMDAGCDHEDILAHCRSEGPHVRGCWVVDLALDKK